MYSDLYGKDVPVVEIEMFVGDLVEMEDSLDPVFDRVIKDGKTTFAFAVLLDHIKSQIKAFHSARMAILKKTGTPTKEGTLFIPKAKIDETNKQIADLTETQITVVVPRISPAEFSATEPVVSASKLAKCFVLFQYWGDQVEEKEDPQQE